MQLHRFCDTELKSDSLLCVDFVDHNDHSCDVTTEIEPFPFDFRAGTVASGIVQ